MSFHFIPYPPASTLTVFIQLIRNSHPDQLMNRIPYLDLDIIPLAHHPDIRLPQFAKKKQRRSSLLPQGQPKGILRATLLDGFLNIPRHTVEPVRWTRSPNALMGPLMIIIGNPVIQPLRCIGKGGKNGIG